MGFTPGHSIFHQWHLIGEPFQIKTTTMTPRQANERLKALDKERDELLKIIESKPTPEQLFLELIQGLEIKLMPENPDSIFFFKNDECFVELDLKNKRFWFDYNNFWSIFNTEFGFNYAGIHKLIKYLLEKHFKLNDFTISGEVRWV